MENGEDEEMPRSQGHIHTSVLFWTRILGWIVSFVIFFVTMNIQSLLLLFYERKGCDGIVFLFGLLFLGLCPIIVITFQALWTIAYGTEVSCLCDNDTGHAGYWITAGHAMEYESKVERCFS